jgi:hypothetical protein
MNTDLRTYVINIFNPGSPDAKCVVVSKTNMEAALVEANALVVNYDRERSALVSDGSIVTITDMTARRTLVRKIAVTRKVALV